MKKKCNCMCADCVYNPYYCVNTPQPCIGADCDICIDKEMAICFCNNHLTIDEINAMIGE